MEHYAGVDVSLERSSLCVVDAHGRIVREAKVASEPEALVIFFRELGAPLIRIGLEAGPLSQWLHAGLVRAGFNVVLLETRQVKAALSAMVVKTDRKDARGIAQLLRMGWFRPVHCKSHGICGNSGGCRRGPLAAAAQVAGGVRSLARRQVTGVGVGIARGRGHHAASGLNDTLDSTGSAWACTVRACARM